MSSVLNRRTPQAPSVSLEKGSYRIRAPISGPLFSLSSSKRHLLSSSESFSPTVGSVSKRESKALPRIGLYEKNLVLLVAFLTLAAIACFSVAYYLFTTSRWATPSTVDLSHQGSDSPLPVAIHNDRFSTLTNVNTNFDIDPTPLQDSVGEEKYLSYLPHSGFHNQRIALENALVLSRLLNRTLLVPPIRLGREAIKYDSFTVLQDNIDNDFRFSRCDGQVQRLEMDPISPIDQGCVTEDDMRAHTYLPWDWLTDFAQVRSEQHVMDQWNLSSGWISSYLEIPSNFILTLPDTTVYHYQFVEDVAVSESHQARDPIYLESVNIAFLLTHPARLIKVGSLFGSSRLKLSRQDTRTIRKNIRQHMVFSQPVLVNISSRIHDILGGDHGNNGFLGAHVRLNDKLYKRTADENARLIWWKLVHRILNLTVEESGNLEARHAKYEFPSFPPTPESISVPNSRLLPPFSPANSSSLAVKPKKRCRGKLHTEESLLPLNIPLFIATDARYPVRNRHLSVFRHTFPCTFFLQDFQEELESMTGLQNPVDGADLTEFLIPFLDAMVVAKARRVVGTRHSTFSWFIHNVLWTRYHGLDIKERSKGL